MGKMNLLIRNDVKKTKQIFVLKCKLCSNLSPAFFHHVQITYDSNCNSNLTSNWRCTVVKIHFSLDIVAQFCQILLTFKIGRQGPIFLCYEAKKWVSLLHIKNSVFVLPSIIQNQSLPSSECDVFSPQISDMKNKLVM